MKTRIKTTTGTMPASYVADKFGVHKMIAPALLVTGIGMSALPFCHTVPEAFTSLVVWAVGSSILGSAPTAYAANLADDKNRTQVLALLRTVGDVGLVVGASSIGLVANLIGNDAAMHVTAGFVGLTSVAFALARK